LDFPRRLGSDKNATLERGSVSAVQNALMALKRRAASGWPSVAFGAKRKWRYHHSHAPLPAAPDDRGVDAGANADIKCGVRDHARGLG